VFPQEKTKERASKEFRRDEATVVAVRQRREMDMAVDQGLAGHDKPNKPNERSIELRFT
jgi:hypothetical protein